MIVQILKRVKVLNIFALVFALIGCDINLVSIDESDKLVKARAGKILTSMTTNIDRSALYKNTASRFKATTSEGKFRIIADFFAYNLNVKEVQFTGYSVIPAEKMIQVYGLINNTDYFFRLSYENEVPYKLLGFQIAPKPYPSSTHYKELNKANFPINPINRTLSLIDGSDVKIKSIKKIHLAFVSEDALEIYYYSDLKMEQAKKIEYQMQYMSHTFVANYAEGLNLKYFALRSLNEHSTSKKYSRLFEKKGDEWIMARPEE